MKLFLLQLLGQINECNNLFTILRTRGEQAKPKGEIMAETNVKELLEAGSHFGHQTRRWNPKMRQYIFGARGGVHIIDLTKTINYLKIRVGWTFKASQGTIIE